MSQEFKLADSAFHRFIQIFQEAVMLGIDGADLMRQMRFVMDENDPNTAVLSPEYVQMVQEHHVKLIQQAQDLKAARDSKSLIIDPEKGGSGERN